MDHYKVKAKHVRRSAFSAIMVWIEDPADPKFNTESIRQQQLTLAWVANHEGIRRKLNVSGRDTDKLARGMIKNFQDDFSDIVVNLYQVASVEQVLSMLAQVAKFIDDCIAENNRQLG